MSNIVIKKNAVRAALARQFSVGEHNVHIEKTTAYGDTLSFDVSVAHYKEHSKQYELIVTLTEKDD